MNTNKLSEMINGKHGKLLAQLVVIVAATTFFVMLFDHYKNHPNSDKRWIKMPCPICLVKK